MEKLLSVVIPVYKVEKYINKCLDSLLVPMNQLTLLDIVVINDGTPDRSADMAREYERKYPGVFRVNDQENRGHGGAWNHGTELAKGKYLFYLDSDDWFNTEDFSKLISYLEHCDVDMVLLDRKKYYAQKDSYEDIVLVNMVPDQIYDANTYDWLGSGNGSNITYAHNTVYRTSMMQKYLPLFCEHVMYDDIILQVMPIMAAERFIYTKLNVYHYLIGRSGQSYAPAVRAKRSEDVTTVLKQVERFIKDNRVAVPEGTTRRAWADFLYSAFCTYHYSELSMFSYNVAKKRLMEWDSYVRENYPDIELSEAVRFYRSSSFPVYYAWFKTYWFLHRCSRHFVRKWIRNHDVSF